MHHQILSSNIADSTLRQRQLNQRKSVRKHPLGICCNLNFEESKFKLLLGFRQLLVELN